MACWTPALCQPRTRSSHENSAVAESSSESGKWRGRRWNDADGREFETVTEWRTGTPREGTVSTNCNRKICVIPSHQGSENLILVNEAADPYLYPWGHPTIS